MKKNILLATAALLLLAACSDNKQAPNGSNPAPTDNSTKEFRSPSGDIVAIRTIKDADTSWAFTNALGDALVPGTDSLWVLSSYQEGQPKEVIFHHKGQQTMYIFYDNLAIWGNGNLKNGLKEGLWTGYDKSTGKKQSETDFVDGLEHGSYVIYYENGTPYIIGQNLNGKPVGEWTYYDKEGNCVGTQKY